MGFPAPIRRAVALLPLVAVLGFAGCGGGASTTSGAEAASPSGAARQAVRIADFAFAPPDFTVAKGTTVEFANEDETAHTATARGSGFDTGAIEPGESAEVTLNRSGTFAYYCAFHPFMKGTITVE
jgi:plastocyanin